MKYNYFSETPKFKPINTTAVYYALTVQKILYRNKPINVMV